MKLRRLATKGDIFAQPKQAEGEARSWQPAKLLAFPRLHYKPVKLLQATGIGTFAALFLIGAGTLITNGQTSLKQFAEPIAASSIDATTADNTTGHWNNDDWNRDRNSYGYGYIPTPEYRYIENTPDIRYNTGSTPNTANISATSQQIIATQQQMAQVMQNCQNSARQLQAQILNMKRQEEQMNRQIDAIWNQTWNIDTSKPDGERRRQQIENQARQLEQARDNLRNNISRAEENFNANKDRCWQAVDALNQRREDLEGRLHDQFGQSLDLPLWYNNY